MENKIRNWFYRYNTEITWFIIGAFVAWGIDELLHGNFVSALIDFGVAYLNYILNKR